MSEPTNRRSRCRKPTLEEWFADYQLRYISRKHVHVPIGIDADVSQLLRRFAAADLAPPWTALLVKAVALTAEQHPEINRAVFRTWRGMRIVEPGYIAVNLPLLIQNRQRGSNRADRFLSAISLRDPQSRSVEQIRQEIRDAGTKDVSQTRVGRWVAGRANTFHNRLRLRLIHSIAYRFPGPFLRAGGGGVSVSSLMNHRSPNFRIVATAFGPTLLTFAAISVSGEGTWRIGVGFDHCGGTGDFVMEALRTFTRILQAEDTTLFERLLEGVKVV